MEYKYQGDEFKDYEKVLLDWGEPIGFRPCTVINWSKHYGGWWCVQLSNGGIHYTKRIVKYDKKKL